MQTLSDLLAIVEIVFVVLAVCLLGWMKATGGIIAVPRRPVDFNEPNFQADYAARQHERQDPGPLDPEQISANLDTARRVNLVFDEGTGIDFDAMEGNETVHTYTDAELHAMRVRASTDGRFDYDPITLEEIRKLPQSVKISAEAARAVLREFERRQTATAAERISASTPEKENPMADNATPSTIKSFDEYAHTGAAVNVPQRAHLRVMSEPIDPTSLIADVDALVITDGIDISEYADDLSLRQQRSTLSALDQAARIHDERANMIRIAINSIVGTINTTANHLDNMTSDVPVRR